MDASLIFLICFGVIFGSLLLGGWHFGHPLLLWYARRKSSRDRTSQNQQTGNEAAQGRSGSAAASRMAEGLNRASENHILHNRSAPSTSDEQPNSSPRASPVRRLSSATSQTRSSDGSDKFTESDLMREPHDLHNMIPVPPVPKKNFSRPVADVGTQVSLFP